METNIDPNDITWKVSYAVGWFCPKCGSVYAPFTNECYRCNPPMEYKVTWNEGIRA